MNKNSTKFLNAKTAGASFSAIIILYLLLSLVGQTILSYLIKPESLFFIAANGLFAPISLTIVILVIKNKSGARLKEIVGVNKFQPKYIFVALFFAIGIFCSLGFVNSLIYAVLDGVGIKVGGINPPLNNVFELLLSILIFAIIPAIVEEGFFRGALLKCFGSFNLSSMLILSASFALYHCSLTQLIYQFGYGLMLVMLAYLSRSTLPSMFAHFLNNFAILLMEYLSVTINLFSPLTIAAGLLSIGIALIILKKKNPNKEEQKVTPVDKVEIKEFFLPFGLFGFIVCAVLSLSIFL